MPCDGLIHVTGEQLDDQCTTTHPGTCPSRRTRSHHDDALLVQIWAFGVGHWQESIHANGQPTALLPSQPPIAGRRRSHAFLDASFGQYVPQHKLRTRWQSVCHRRTPRTQSLQHGFLLRPRTAVLRQQQRWFPSSIFPQQPFQQRLHERPHERACYLQSQSFPFLATASAAVNVQQLDPVQLAVHAESIQQQWTRFNAAS